MTTRTNATTREAESLRKNEKSGSIEKTVSVGDTLMPLMVVESSVVSSDGSTVTSRTSSSSDIQPKLSRTFSSCDIIYTKPDARQNASRFTKKVAKCEHQYHSHEALPSESKVNPKLLRLTRTQSEQVDMEDNAAAEKTSVAQSRWGVLQSKAIALNQVKKDKRRAQIVANVTKRLYKKKVETPPEPVINVAQQKEGEDDNEPEELKICSRARASLLELTRKALSAHRRRREVETQTEFCGHVIRVKEVGVGTDNSELSCDRTATERQCSITSHMFISKGVGTNSDDIKYTTMDDVYRRWGYHYRNGSGGQHARAWNYYADSVIFTEHRFFKSNEEEFSDDSLDSNPDFDVKIQVEGLKKTEKPCVWKVVSITSGQMFNNKMRPEVSKVNSCRSISIPNEEVNNQEDKAGLIKAAGTSESAIDNNQRTSGECTCQVDVKELHFMVKSLQQSVEELNKKRNTPACMVQVCHGRVSHCHCEQVTVEQDSETCDSCKQKTGSKPTPNTKTQDLIGIVDCTSQASKFGGINGGKLTLSRIRGFLYRWRSKCKVERKCADSPIEHDNAKYTSKSSCGITFSQKHKELIILQKPKKSTDKLNAGPTEIALTKDPILKCEPISTKSNCRLLEDETEKADIRKCSDIVSSETSHLKAFMLTVKEFMKKNSIQRIPKNQSLTFYMEMLKSIIQKQNTIPKLRHLNGVISEVSLQNNEINVEQGVPSTKPDVQLAHASVNQTETLIRGIPEDEVLDVFDDFMDDDKFPLPRTTPLLLNYDKRNISENSRPDKDVEHWMDIKCLILGHNFETFPDDDEDLVERGSVKKKSVTWKDFCGCGDLVQLRSLSPYDTFEHAIPNMYYERNSAVNSNLRRENASPNYERDIMLDEGGFNLEPLNELDRYSPWKDSFEERLKLDLLSSPPKKRSKPDVYWHKNNVHEFIRRDYDPPKMKFNLEKDSLNLLEKYSTCSPDKKNCTTNMCVKFSSRSKYYQEKRKQISQILEKRKRIQHNEISRSSTQLQYQPTQPLALHRKEVHFPWKPLPGQQASVGDMMLPHRYTDLDLGSNIKRKYFDVGEMNDHSARPIPNNNLSSTHNYQLTGGGSHIISDQPYITPNNSLDSERTTLRYKPQIYNCSSNSRNLMYHAWQSGYWTSNGLGVTTEEINECTPLRVNDSYKSRPIVVLDYNKNFLYSCCNNSNCKCELQQGPYSIRSGDSNRTRSRSFQPPGQEHRRASPSEYMRQLLAIRRQVVSASHGTDSSV